ncbi:MAG: hypothetical protein FWD42_02970 [Solirubrobacterales bacterium]|nr:hypothetical protein [Solirubrobacterales bacterium]
MINLISVASKNKCPTLAARAVDRAALTPIEHVCDPYGIALHRAQLEQASELEAATLACGVVGA